VDEEFNSEAIFLSPNLGCPILLNFSDRKKEGFCITSIACSHSENLDNLNKMLLDSIKLIPLFESKWKQRRERRKFRFKFWKKPKMMNPSIHTNIIRGDPIELKIIQSERFNPSFDEFIEVDHYRKKGIFTGNCFQILLEFSIDKEVKRYLKDYNFLMFDLAHKLKDERERVNYHSVVISKNKWDNFTFVQASDLHVADRNDNIYEIIKNWLSGFRTKAFADIAKFSLNSFTFIKKSILKFFNQDEAKTEPERMMPLRKRLINPNNNLRKFIRLMNKKVLRNELDFIILTGDLIDYSTLSNLPADFNKSSNFDYENSNWKVLKDILLNRPQKVRRGIIRGEEILCPIFTIPGNHDFRPYHYDIRWGNLYKKIGLNLNEAIALNDKLAANPIGSITRNFLALSGYLLEFNFKLNYTFKLGKYNFVLLNSGPDSFKNLRDFISGHPSATGLTNKQIHYLEYLINNVFNDKEHTFLFLHCPPINPQKKISIFDRFILAKVSGGLSRDFKHFKESLGLTKHKSRIDSRFNLKYGTISSNWEKLINFCKDHCFVTFSGHTHEFKEFRLENPEKSKTKVLDAPPFVLRKIENPAAVFYDVYSEINTDFRTIQNNSPYILQTPALGLGGYHNPKLAGAYREIKIEKGKLASFKVFFINK
jgi:predicted MPP superfamily phosphohydrolase